MFLGVYKLMDDEFNNHPAYQSVKGDERYIAFINGRWFITTLLSTCCGNEKFRSLNATRSPPSQVWEYKFTGPWEKDLTIRLTPNNIKGKKLNIQII